MSRGPRGCVPLLHREVGGVRHPGQEHDHQGLGAGEPQHLRERAETLAQGVLHRQGGHAARSGQWEKKRLEKSNTFHDHVNIYVVEWILIFKKNIF